MGLYNVLFGRNPYAREILAAIDLTPELVGRFRDVTVHNGEIAVYTRNGGGNRECINTNCWYASSRDQCDNVFCMTHHNNPRENQKDWDGDCGDPDCYACTINHRLPKHKLYLRDKDDDFDFTYATIYFRIPEEIAPFLAVFDTGKEWSPDKKWEDMLEGIKAGTVPIPQQVQAMFGKIMEQLGGKVEGGKDA